MPWVKGDAKRFTKKADTATKRRQWAHVAEGARARGASEESAIKQANAVVGGTARHRRKKR